ncbi:hypothetical protein [Thiorhodococcus mannitoliphagus]|nr:hypothetical protein [Thiorhodococcus mannitoliphagus]
MNESETDASSFTAWWNADSRQCLSVEIRECKITMAEGIVEGSCL